MTQQSWLIICLADISCIRLGTRETSRTWKELEQRVPYPATEREDPSTVYAVRWREELREERWVK
jgi:hypothetical protein